MARRSTEKVIAHHEAGHAVAALRLGVPVASVTIDPERDDGGITLGQVRFRSGDRDPPSLGHRLLVISLSGPAAQRLYRPRSPVRMNGASDFAHAQRESELCSSDPTAARSLHRWGEREARHLVAREWWLVERIADILMERRTISGEELEQALAPIEAARKAAAAEYRCAFLRTPEQLQKLQEERDSAWRRMRTMRSSDVASAAWRVLVDVLARGEPVELEKIRSAINFSLVCAGFDEDAAREKVDALIMARVPHVGWKRVNDMVSWKAVAVDGQDRRDGGPGGTGDARPAQPIIPEAEAENAA